MKNLVTTYFTLWVLNFGYWSPNIENESLSIHAEMANHIPRSSSPSTCFFFVIYFVPLAYARPEYVGCSNYDAANMAVTSEQVRLVLTSVRLTQRPIMVTLHYKSGM